MKQGANIKESVKDLYERVAGEGEVCSCCLDQSEDVDLFAQALFLGYREEDLRNIPSEALMGLGSGNPLALIDLHEGQLVLDLGSGGGVDCFLASRRVGETGQVIGIDMASAMVRRARSLAIQHGYENIRFGVGEIENLPLGDGSIDAVVSNCVINLTSDKLTTFKEALRVLKPKGRIVLSDMVADGELSEYVKWSFQAWTGCQAGLIQKQEYVALLQKAGFTDVEIVQERPFQKLGIGDNSGEEIKSIQVRAIKDQQFHALGRECVS